MKPAAVLLLQCFETTALLFQTRVVDGMHGATTKGGETGTKDHSGVEQIPIFHNAFP